MRTPPRIPEAGARVTFERASVSPFADGEGHAWSGGVLWRAPHKPPGCRPLAGFGGSSEGGVRPAQGGKVSSRTASHARREPSQGEGGPPGSLARGQRLFLHHPEGGPSKLLREARRERRSVLAGPGSGLRGSSPRTSCGPQHPSRPHTFRARKPSPSALLRGEPEVSRTCRRRVGADSTSPLAVAGAPPGLASRDEPWKPGGDCSGSAPCAS